MVQEKVALLNLGNFAELTKFLLPPDSRIKMVFIQTGRIIHFKIMRKILFLLAIAGATLPSQAILYKCDDFNTSKKTCTLVGWGGTQPSSGKLKIPSTFTHTDGVTYTVTKVAVHALDNLTEVTQVTIPATITWFGNVHDVMVVNSFTENFYNCPNLETFIVEEGSPIFETTPKGLLLNKKKNELIQVPQNFSTTGNLTVPSSIEYISPTALVENSTITSLKIQQNVEIFDNGGINRMLNLKKIELEDVRPHKLTMINNVLVSSGRVVATAPLGGLTSFTVPENVNKISPYAFYNVKTLSEITIPSWVYEIGQYAFAGSGITSLSIPGAVDTLNPYIIFGCEQLKSLHLEMAKPIIPENFAAGCSSLESVTSENPINEVRESAFKNCRSLKEFPFSGKTDLSFDSAFYNTGVEEVVFEESFPVNRMYGASLFEKCRNLKKVDFSKIKMDNDDESNVSIGPDFASNCLQLKHVVFPRFCTFWRYVNSSVFPAFGFSCAVDTIDISTCWGSHHPQFVYSTLNGKRDFTPHVYAALTKNTEIAENWNRLPIGNLFSAGNGATVHPIIYIDSNSQPIADFDEEIFVFPDALYFIPGGCSSKYSYLTENNCKFYEMYDIRFDKTVKGKLRVTVTPYTDIENLHPIEDIWVGFDGTEKHSIFSDGSATSSTLIDDVKSVRLFYTVDGRKFSTDYYPESWIATGVEEIEYADPADPSPVYDLSGKAADNSQPGIRIIKENGKYVKRLLHR